MIPISATRDPLCDIPRTIWRDGNVVGTESSGERYHGWVDGWPCCALHSHGKTAQSSAYKNALACASHARAVYEATGELPTLRREAYIWRAG